MGTKETWEATMGEITDRLGKAGVFEGIALEKHEIAAELYLQIVKAKVLGGMMAKVERKHETGALKFLFEAYAEVIASLIAPLAAQLGITSQQFSSRIGAAEEVMEQMGAERAGAQADKPVWGPGTMMC